MTVSKYSEVYPSSHLALPDDEVHIWHVALDDPVLGLEKLEQTLSTDECMRASRFHFERDRRHFVVGRGMLRSILGLYLKTEPEKLRFSYGVYGKPSLLDDSGDNTLRFNLAHSHGLAIYGFVRNREIGIDLEYIYRIPDIDQIAERFFSKYENSVLRKLSTDEKQEAFFNCWTRKEAYIKATGNGLACPLDQFDVSLMPGEPARLLRVNGDKKEASRWSLEALTLDPGYVGALAVAGHDWQVRHWKWSNK